MAQQTLLQMTQDILSSLDSDEVNSIGDTVESLQVANIIKNKYYDIQTRSGLPSQKVLFQLLPSLDVTQPVLMTLPSGTSEIEWIKYYDANPNDNEQQDQFGAYAHDLNTDLVSTSSWTTTSTTSNTIGTGNKTFTVASSTLPVTVGQTATATSGTNSMSGPVVSYVGSSLTINVTVTAGSGVFSSWTISNSGVSTVPGYKYVTMLPIPEFLNMVNRFNPSESNVGTMIFSEVIEEFGTQGFILLFKTDKQPQYCTVIENKYVLFDSYDATLDGTLQASKTMAYGYTVSPFQMVDNFIPDLDDNEFPLLYNESKSAAFYELKQMPHLKADQEIKRQWSTVQKNKSKDNKPSYFNQFADFGRVPRTGGFASGGYGAYKWMRQAGP